MGNRYLSPWVVPAIAAVPPPREFESGGLSKQKQPALAGLMHRLPIPAIAASGTKPELSAALYCVRWCSIAGLDCGRDTD